MYIRTKDKIYDLSNKYSQTPEEVQIALMNGNYKQADTIEELCDGYYLDFGGVFNVNFVYGKNELNYLKRQYSQNIKCGEIVKIKGFIKTSNGLIYVAKTNDKGELELI